MRVILEEGPDSSGYIPHTRGLNRYDIGAVVSKELGAKGPTDVVTQI